MSEKADELDINKLPYGERMEYFKNKLKEKMANDKMSAAIKKAAEEFEAAGSPEGGVPEKDKIGHD
ncbi:MAG: hypothetical protein ABSC49_00210 [Candidatus Microgenomates bacterium]|jgi:hypothetical protein